MSEDSPETVAEPTDMVVPWEKLHGKGVNVKEMTKLIDRLMGMSKSAEPRYAACILAVVDELEAWVAVKDKRAKKITAQRAHRIKTGKETPEDAAAGQEAADLYKCLRKRYEEVFGSKMPTQSWGADMSMLKRLIKEGTEADRIAVLYDEFLSCGSNNSTFQASRIFGFGRVQDFITALALIESKVKTEAMSRENASKPRLPADLAMKFRQQRQSQGEIILP